MASFNESPIVLRVALFVAPVACLLQVIGMAYPNWLEIKGANEGLWKVCNQGICAEYLLAPDWFNEVRSMEVLGFLFSLEAIEGIAFSILFPPGSMKKAFKLLSIVASFAATSFILIGVIRYVVKLNESSTVSITPYLSWAFGLCIAAAILSGINGILVISSLCNGSNTKS